MAEAWQTDEFNIELQADFRVAEEWQTVEFKIELQADGRWQTVEFKIKLQAVLAEHGKMIALEEDRTKAEASDDTMDVEV